MIARKLYLLSGGQLKIDLNKIEPSEFFAFSEAYNSIIREVGAVFLTALLAVHSTDKQDRIRAARAIFGDARTPSVRRSRKDLAKVMAKQRVKHEVAMRLGAARKGT